MLIVHQAKSCRAFTLIELLIVIAIMSITLMVGMPSMQEIITNTRLTNAANSMVSALQLARAEALKQHKTVVVAKNNDWINGWSVFVDNNDDNIQNDDEPTLAAFDSLNPNLMVFAGKYPNYASYSENGRINTNGRFSFCSSTGENQNFRSVVLALTGRIHIESASSTPSSTYIEDCTQ